MINRFVFSQINLDSSSITMLASVAHKFSEPGEYYGEIFRGTETVGKFTIMVSDCPTPSVVSPEIRQQSVKIDLKSIEQPVSLQPKSQICNCFNLKPNGYALFYVSTGTGGYRIEIKNPQREGAKVFDNCELKENDLFIATPIRPGTYRITNTYTNASAELTVTYPEIGKTQRNASPTQVECTQDAITPNNIKINPAQALVISFKAPSRIKIELTKPEDRPRTTQTKEPTAEQTKEQATIQIQKKKPIRQLHINPR